MTETHFHINMPHLGQTYSHYTLQKLIRKTNLSCVYTAIDNETHKTVAVKFIYVCDANKSKVDNELQLMKELSSPYIIKPCDTFDYSEFACIVMPYCEIGDLSKNPKISKGLSENEARKIFQSILLGLKYLHDQNIWHRDVKMENILLNNRNEAVLTDFGLAIKNPQKQPLTEFVGTVQYAAPEIINNEPYDESVDIWSLGVTLYQMVSGTFPFPLSPETTLRRCISKAAYFFPAQQWRNKSKEVKNLIEKMIVVDPSKRITIDEALAHPWLKNRE